MLIFKFLEMTSQDIEYRYSFKLIRLMKYASQGTLTDTAHVFSEPLKQKYIHKHTDCELIW